MGQPHISHHACQHAMHLSSRLQVLSDNRRDCKGSCGFGGHVAEVLRLSAWPHSPKLFSPSLLSPSSVRPSPETRHWSASPDSFENHVSRRVAKRWLPRASISWRVRRHFASIGQGPCPLSLQHPVVPTSNVLCGVAVYLCYQSVKLVATMTWQQCMRTAIHVLLSPLLDASGHSHVSEAWEGPAVDDRETTARIHVEKGPSWIEMNLFSRLTVNESRHSKVESSGPKSRGRKGLTGCRSLLRMALTATIAQSHNPLRA